MKKIPKYNIYELSITDDRLYDPVISFASFIMAVLIVIAQILLKDNYLGLKVIMILSVARVIWYHVLAILTE